MLLVFQIGIELLHCLEGKYDVRTNPPKLVERQYSRMP